MQIIVDVDHQETLCYDPAEYEYEHEHEHESASLSLQSLSRWATQRARRETRVEAFRSGDKGSDRESDEDDELSLCCEMESLSFAESEAHTHTSLPDILFLSLSLSSSLAGGKGGFGAQLRALAKQRGKKPTTNFSACRDLQGRRLRHVNDEILLEKWRESRDRGEAFDPAQETASGIQLWFLSTPAWADVRKSDRKQRWRAKQDKRSLCRDWLAARESLTESERARKPRHWGCPRGERCGFAHGEEDLRGEARERAKERAEEEERERRRAERERYVAPIHAEQERRSEAVVQEMVLRGLQRERERERENKRMKIEHESSETVQETHTGNAAETVCESTEGFATLMCGQCIVRYNFLDSVTSSVTEGEKAEKDKNDGLIALLTANDKFPTIALHTEPHTLTLANDLSPAYFPLQQHLFSPTSLSCGLSLGQWYYEVELLSDGLMQIGFASDRALCESAVWDSANGVGVGDDAHSWAVDGMREKVFHHGEERDIVWGESVREKRESATHADANTEKEKEKGWSAGDVVGCFLSLTVLPNTTDRQAHIAFSLNGKWASHSFTFTLSSEKEGERETVFFPALSLEDRESVLVNTGHAPFRFFPTASPSLPRVSSRRNNKEEGEKKYKDMKIRAVCEIETLKELKAEDFVREEAEQTNGDSSAQSSFDPINLETEEFSSVEALEALGLEKLKSELSRRGLKSGGTLKERAARLLQVRGVPAHKIDKRLKAK